MAIDPPTKPHTEIIIAAIDMPLYRAFLQHQKEFKVLLEAGVFELAHGKATINKHEGHIQNIHVEKRTYQYPSPREKGA